MIETIEKRIMSNCKNIDMILTDKDFISDPRTLVTLFKVLKTIIDLQIEIVEAFKNVENIEALDKEKITIYLFPIHDGVSNWLGVLLDEFEEYSERNQHLLNRMWEILNILDSVGTQYNLNGIPLMDCVFTIGNNESLRDYLMNRNSELVNRLEREKNNLDILIEEFNK